jgi:N-acyl-D-amino-acid deacylase
MHRIVCRQPPELNAITRLNNAQKSWNFGLIKNGRVIDGSGTPAFHGDVAVRNGKIAEIGRLRGSAARTIDAEGAVVAPGFIDTHCHYDAQVTWDPLCTFSCYHGVTSVLIGNCSLALAPLRRGGEERLAEFLSYVEAIPMEALKTVDMNWETIAEYMARVIGEMMHYAAAGSWYNP